MHFSATLDNRFVLMTEHVTIYALTVIYETQNPCGQGI